MKFKYLFIAFLILQFSHCLSFVGWNITLGSRLEKVVLFVLAVYCITNIKKVPQTGMRPFVTAYMIIPFISILGSYSIHGQSVSEGFLVTMFSLSYLFFYLLNILKVDYNVVLKMCMILGVFWVAMEAIQQFTYPSYWFSTQKESLDKVIEIRNGIYRFNMEGREFGLLLLFYSFQKYMEKPQKKFLIGIVLGLVGVYLLATRQIMAASMICLLYGMFAKKKIKITSFIVILIMAFLIYYNMDTLFGGFIEMTEGVDEDYIRFIAYEYFGLTYNEGNIWSMLFGNGIAGASAYGTEMKKLMDVGLFQADIGIVGMYSWYGIFYVIAVLAFFSFIFAKRNSIDLYLKMYVLYMFVTTPMLHHFGYSTHHIMALCMILYLIDCSMEKNKNTLNCNLINV